MNARTFLTGSILAAGATVAPAEDPPGDLRDLKLRDIEGPCDRIGPAPGFPR